MKYHYLLVTLLLFTSAFVQIQAQTILSGKVIDQKTGKPVLFATVSIPGERGGTYTQEDGTFSIKTLTGDSIYITMLGYQPLKTSVEDDGIYSLQATTYGLKEVVVTDHRRKIRREKFGDSRYAFNGYSGWWGDVVARRVGQYTTKSGILTKAVYRLDVDGNKCSVFARVRLFANQENRPGEDLLNKNILIKLRGGKNKYEVDLSEEHIVFPPGGLYVGVEFLTPGEDCAEVKDDKRRFYVLMAKAKDPRTWKRNIRGKWGPMIIFRDRVPNNARFSVEVDY